MKRVVTVVAVIVASFTGEPGNAAPDINAQRGVIDFLAPVERDPILQHAKEVYVGYGCAYCHGVDLRVRNGEAADLYASGLVGFDENGELIGPLVRAGVAATEKLSPMPQFADLGEHEMAAIVRWIHHARQQRKFDELAAAKPVRGDPAEGKAFFAAYCVSCHAAGSDFASLRAAGDGRALARQILRPAFVEQGRGTMAVDVPVDARKDAARARHLSLLERFDATTVGDLAAYVMSWPVPSPSRAQ